MEYKYINEARTQELIDEIKRRLNVRLIVTDTMPESAEDGAMRLYSGETDVTYVQSHIYRYNEAEAKWEDVTSDNDKYPIAWDVELTQAEYDELPDDKISDDKNYYITDGEVEDTIVYGWHIDPDEADSDMCVTYLNDAVGMTPAAMGATAFNYGTWEDAFFMPRPCMLKSDCTVDYYLDPSDYSKKEDGTPSDIANPDYDGNAMMEWGLIWFKFENGVATGEGTFSVSNKQIDDTYDCPCNRDANGDIIPHFYTAIYDGTGTDKLRSLSGIQLTSENGSGGTTGEEEINRAVANNTTGDTEWYTDVLCDRMLISALHILISCSLNSQGKFGRGLDNNHVEETGRELKEAYVTGSLNDKGMFYGDITDGHTGVKTFGMENWWGCVWRRTAGLIGTDGGYAYKMTMPYDTAGAGYQELTLEQPPAGDISQCVFGDFGYLPIATDGSTSTYYADTYHRGEGYALTGNCAASGLNCGCSSLGVHAPLEQTAWSVSTTLSCKPLASRFN